MRPCRPENLQRLGANLSSVVSAIGNYQSGCLRRAQAELLDWHGSGLSVMEMSHRGKYFCEIAETAKTNLRKLLSIPENYTIFFF